MNTDPEVERINALTEKIIGCAIEVHRHLGAGLLEHTYEAAMCLEMDRRRIAYDRQAVFAITYKGTGLRVGLLINFNGSVLRTGVKRFVL